MSAWPLDLTLELQELDQSSPEVKSERLENVSMRSIR